MWGHTHIYIYIASKKKHICPTGLRDLHNRFVIVWLLQNWAWDSKAHTTWRTYLTNYLTRYLLGDNTKKCPLTIIEHNTISKEVSVSHYCVIFVWVCVPNKRLVQVSLEWVILAPVFKKLMPIFALEHHELPLDPIAWIINGIHSPWQKFVRRPN